MFKITHWIDDADEAQNYRVPPEGWSSKLIDEVIIKDIVEHQYCFTGQDHDQHGGYVPILDYQYVVEMGWRAWGALMADAWNIIHPQGKALPFPIGLETPLSPFYTYMDFYMPHFFPSNLKYNFPVCATTVRFWDKLERFDILINPIDEGISFFHADKQENITWLIAHLNSLYLIETENDRLGICVESNWAQHNRYIFFFTRSAKPEIKEFFQKLTREKLAHLGYWRTDHQKFYFFKKEEVANDNPKIS